MGADSVQTVDPYDLEAVKEAITKAMEEKGLSVIVSRRECVLLTRKRYAPALSVDPDKCTGCMLCLRLGCPAIEVTEEGMVQINALLCNGCGLCSQVCRVEAIY